MSQPELLRKVIRSLDDAGIDYMVTGSIASSLHGEPRTTHDVDLVLSLDEKSVKRLIGLFTPPDFYLDEESIIGAVKNKGMFNLIDVRTGDKVDFWMLTDEPFDRSRFARKITEEVMGIKMKVSTPEDTILSKLWWVKLSGGSEKHFYDALHVYEVQFGKLDTDYLSTWSKELEVDEAFKRLRREALPL